jgi:hypothetical protein
MSTPRDNWPAVAALSSAIHFGGSGLSDVPVLIERVINDGSWKIFQNELSADPFENETFEEFVTSDPMKGLGASRELVVRLVKGTPAELLVRDALKGRPSPGSAGTNQGNNVTPVGRTTVTGNRRDYTLDRLQRDAPELFEAVKRKELSSNAAAIKAGFRPKTFTVRADKPESIAATLRRQLSPEVLALVAKMLSEDR